MNIENIKNRVFAIERMAHDDEIAHTAEDLLFRFFIQSIADGSYQGDIREGAKECLKSLEIDFNRWSA